MELVFRIVAIAVLAYSASILIAVLIKLVHANSSEFSQRRQLQGGFRAFLSGRFRVGRSVKDADFEVMHGLTWNHETKQYETSQALSVESFRSVFPK